MNIRLLEEHEIQRAINVAHEAYRACLLPLVRSEEEVALYNNYVNLEHIWKQVHEGSLFLWGLFEQEELCAVSAMQKNGHITMLYVRPMYQRRGYGKTLVLYMRGYAKERLGLERVTVNVIPIAAAPFFYRQKFQPVLSGNPQKNYLPMTISSREDFSLQPKRNVSSGAIIAVISIFLTIIVVIALAFSVYHVVAEGMDSSLPEPRQEVVPSEEPDATEESESEDTEEQKEAIKDNSEDKELEEVECSDGRGVTIIAKESDMYRAQDCEYTLNPENFSYDEDNEAGKKEINVNYPQLVFTDGRDASAMNQKIRDTACYYMDMIYPTIDESYQMEESLGKYNYMTEVEYQVTYMDNHLLSVTFRSHYWMGDSILEKCDIYALNFNVQTGELYYIEDILSPDEEFAQSYYEALCEQEPSLKKAEGITTDLLARTLTGEVVDNRFYSNYSVCKDKIKINFTFHYASNHLYLAGADTVCYWTADLAPYQTSSDFWQFYEAE